MVCDSAKGGCGKVYITAGLLEDYVRDQILDALDQPEVMGAVRAAREGTDSAAVVAQIVDLDRRLDDAAEAYAAGEISRRQLATATARLRDRLEPLQRTLATATAPAPIVNVGVLASFDDRPVEWRHRLASTLIEAVRVGPAKVRGRNRFDPARVTIRWR
jgi:hypothetical protein